MPIEQRDRTCGAIGVAVSADAAKGGALLDFPLPLPARCRASGKRKRASGRRSGHWCVVILIAAQPRLGAR